MNRANWKSLNYLERVRYRQEVFGELEEMHDETTRYAELHGYESPQVQYMMGLMVKGLLLLDEIDDSLKTPQRRVQIY